MKIALDATPLVSSGKSGLSGGGIGVAGGITRYLLELLGALAQDYPEDEYVLLAERPFALPLDLPNVTAGSPSETLLDRRWWTFGLRRELRRQAADVFHGVNFAVPFPASIPAVVTVHDLSPWKKRSENSWVDSEWERRSARVRKRAPWLLRTGAARHILTPSEAIRREVIGRFGIAPERVTAIPLAASPRFRPTPESKRPAKPYFLYVGMLEPRKNVTSIVEAWSELRKSVEIDLVIAGPRRPEMPVPPAQPGLILRGEVPEDELPSLYSGAIGFVYPSHYEGFGLPVLEAMQCGAPVIISPDPALRETAGDAGIVAASASQLIQAMQTAWKEQEIWRSRSLARAALFSWTRTARATRDVYDNVHVKVS